MRFDFTPDYFVVVSFCMRCLKAQWPAAELHVPQRYQLPVYFSTQSESRFFVRRVNPLEYYPIKGRRSGINDELCMDVCKILC